MKTDKEVFEKIHWNILLNTNCPNILVNNSRNDLFSKCPESKYHIIGKNAIFYGKPENIYHTRNITIIGYARIYNEPSLWKLISKSLENQYTHSLAIVLKMYEKYGFETMLDYLDGDFSFVLLDFNIMGEESYLFIARDPFGIFPFYKIELPDTSQKKVQFIANQTTEFAENSSIHEMKSAGFYQPLVDISSKPNHFIYGFSSDTSTFSDLIYDTLSTGNYQSFTHSHKVSGIWKIKENPISFYHLPFHSTYICETPVQTFSIPDNNNRIDRKIATSIEKRLKWLFPKYKEGENSIAILSNNSNSDNSNTKLCVHFLSIEHIYPFIGYDNYTKIIHIPESFYQDITSDKMDSLTTKYPTIIQQIKSQSESNDPAIIRAHFIPRMMVKYIQDNYPEIRAVFMSEKWTYEYLEMDMFDRRKLMKDVYFLEKIRGWTEIFLENGLDLYMPFLDRMLIQCTDQYSIV
jgi:hypothetical protein